MKLDAHRNAGKAVSIDQLRQYDQKWIAISPDGTRVVAAAENLLDLERLVRAAGEDPETVGLERVEFEDVSTGGAELL